MIEYTVKVSEDKTEWRLDGREWVAEVHRTWR